MAKTLDERFNRGEISFAEFYHRSTLEEIATDKTPEAEAARGRINASLDRLTHDPCRFG